VIVTENIVVGIMNRAIFAAKPTRTHIGQGIGL
jgi:hypothetical protein